MILLKNVPFERQAQFLYDNICAYPDHPAFEVELSKQAARIADRIFSLRPVPQKVQG